MAFYKSKRVFLSRPPKKNKAHPIPHHFNHQALSKGKVPVPPLWNPLHVTWQCPAWFGSHCGMSSPVQRVWKFSNSSWTWAKSYWGWVATQIETSDKVIETLNSRNSGVPAAGVGTLGSEYPPPAKGFLPQACSSIQSFLDLLILVLHDCTYYILDALPIRNSFVLPLSQLSRCQVRNEGIIWNHRCTGAPNKIHSQLWESFWMRNTVHVAKKWFGNCLVYGRN